MEKFARWYEGLTDSEKEAFAEFGQELENVLDEAVDKMCDMITQFTKAVVMSAVEREEKENNAQDPGSQP